MTLMMIFSGCSPKPVKSVKDFQTYMTNAGLALGEATEQFEGNESVKCVWIAAPEDLSYQVEFYQLTDDKYARGAYEANRDNANEIENSVDVHTEKIAANYARFTRKTSDTFVLISQIGDTMIYSEVPSEYAETVSKLVSEFGY